MMAFIRVLFNKFITSGTHCFSPIFCLSDCVFFNDFCFAPEKVSSNWLLKFTGFDAVYIGRPVAAILGVFFSFFTKTFFRNFKSL